MHLPVFSCFCWKTSWKENNIHQSLRKVQSWVLTHSVVLNPCLIWTLLWLSPSSLKCKTTDCTEWNLHVGFRAQEWRQIWHKQQEVWWQHLPLSFITDAFWSLLGCLKAECQGGNQFCFLCVLFNPTLRAESENNTGLKAGHKQITKCLPPWPPL